MEAAEAAEVANELFDLFSEIRNKTGCGTIFKANFLKNEHTLDAIRLCRLSPIIRRPALDVARPLLGVIVITMYPMIIVTYGCYCIVAS